MDRWSLKGIVGEREDGGGYTNTHTQTPTHTHTQSTHFRANAICCVRHRQFIEFIYMQSLA